MFRQMRRKEKQLSLEESLEILNLADEGILATTGPDGYPYAVPLNFVYHGGGIVFHCAKSGHKLDNINHNPRVSFCVVHESEIIPLSFSTRYKSVVVFGRAVELFDQKMEEGLLALVNKFSKDHVEAGKKYIDDSKHQTRVFTVKIEQITGKAGKK
ncbi:MAG: pyridoxamine 5'-phosphate oxidase family protein [Desulfobacterium sp.]|jgi:nitroimidazol reductase NimA-like FMN-containing flavoprotein (pyridoxamine 5'-phosphate oxidase superfamily)|nr:pyridoxamine 5'-phosphate oxidase family protein [Desulfobacterium sp.]